MFGMNSRAHSFTLKCCLDFSFRVSRCNFHSNEGNSEDIALISKDFRKPDLGFSRMLYIHFFSIALKERCASTVTLLYLIGQYLVEGAEMHNRTALLVTVRLEVLVWEFSMTTF